MQERTTLTQREINRDLLRGIFTTPLWFLILVGILGLGVAAGAGAFGWMINHGLGVTGLNRPVMWGFFITNLVFWIGISHAGVMLSAILRLTQAEWRRPATRAAEILTLFSLMTAMLMPLIHSGRPWRTFYWESIPFSPIPYDFARGIWPNIRSPLVWDPSAINTYLISSTLFVFIALLPDLAVLRDRTKGFPHVVYSVLALGWRGSPRQWKLQVVAGLLLSALILPVFVSVHSIVSWDFGMAMAVESWHSTVFAPYFVIGAVHSGVSGVVTLMILMRWLFHWEDYIRLEHFDSLGRLLIVVAIAWLFFTFVEIMYSLYMQEPQELALRTMIFFEWPWNAMFIIFLLTGFFIPVPLWMFRRVRRSVFMMFWTTILVNIGMWLERFLIIVPGLARKQAFTMTWATYKPSPIEIIIVLASFCMVAMLILLFSKVFPLIPLSDAKEARIVQDEIQIGKVKVPAVIREM